MLCRVVAWRTKKRDPYSEHSLTVQYFNIFYDFHCIVIAI